MPETPPLAPEALVAHQGPVLFIADAANGVERKLLDACLDRIGSEREGRERVFVEIGRVRGRPDLDGLARRLVATADTLLVPVRVAWSVPGMEKDSRQPVALRHLLFGDPRRPGALRARRILQRDPGRAQCIAGAAATLGDLRARFATQVDASEPPDAEAFAAFVARQAAVALEIAEWQVIGRRYKVPRLVAESLGSSPRFRAALKGFAAESGRPADEVSTEAEGYMRELVAVPNALFVDLRARFDNFILSLGYDKEVVCQDEDLERLREIVQTRPAMLLFTHKTYIDSVALTAKLFENDFPMLHIFAGANMGFLGLASLMKRSGGIFIRRSFQDKPLYKLVLRHYIGYLMEKRFPMTWAFEGTRSRTGKLMPPRYGLLKYVLEAADVTDARDIHVIPVAVSYDLMRDVPEYASEQLGRVKKPESLKWFIGYLSSLRQPMGRMYLDFGEPVVLERAPDPEDSLALAKIAFAVAVQANKVAPITLPAIGCMVLLGAAPRALTIRELQGEILRLVRWARDRGIRLSSDFSPERTGHVRELANRMVEIGLLFRFDEGSDLVFGIPPEQHANAGYYRNTIIHHFVNKAIMELALLAAADAPPVEASNLFWSEAERLRDWFKFEFFYPDKRAFRRQLKQELAWVDPEWRARLQDGGAAITGLLEQTRPLVAHASLLPYVEAYTVVFDLLARLQAGESLSAEDCVSRALREGKQLYLQRRITSEASIGKILFSNGYQLAANLGLVEGGGEALTERRIRLLKDFKELSRRLDRIRLMALSDDALRRSRARRTIDDATT